MNTTHYLVALAVARTLLGLAPIVAARATSRLLGFPEAHDNPTARLMARLFGVRDIGLGAMVVLALGHPIATHIALQVNLAMDLGDVVMISVPLLRRQGVDRAAGLCLFFALAGAAAWVLALHLTGAP